MFVMTNNFNSIVQSHCMMLNHVSTHCSPLISPISNSPMSSMLALIMLRNTQMTMMNLDQPYFEYPNWLHSHQNQRIHIGM